MNANIKGRARTVVIRTTYEPFGDSVVPRALWVEVSGQSSSLRSAREEFRQLAEAVGNVLAVSMHGAVDHFAPSVVFDASPRRPEHEFWQMPVVGETGWPRHARLVQPDLIDKAMGCLEGHSQREELEIAMGQYREAMRHIIPGEWLLALAHAWMGFEALKQAALDRELHRRGLSAAALAAAWSVPTRQLVNEARRRLLFGRSAALHDRLRDTSNDLEHALVQFGPLQKRASRDARAGVTRLRRAILDLLFGRVPRAFGARELSAPFPCARHQQFVTATLVGSPEALPPPEAQYPHAEVVTAPKSAIYKADGTYEISVDVTVLVKHGPNVDVRDLKHEVVAPPGVVIPEP